MRKLLLFLLLASPVYGQGLFLGNNGLVGNATPSGPLWIGILSSTAGGSACTFLASGTYAACAPPEPGGWSTAGINGGIPSGSWTQSGSTITSTGSDQSSAIQTALNTCSGTNKYVLLASGTFQIASHVTVPGGCELRGGGANNTILNPTSTGGGAVVSLGSSIVYPDSTKATNVTAGYSAGSTSLTVASATNFTTGGYAIISELNLGPYVTISGGPGGGNCTGGQCTLVYNWGPLSGITRSSGQVVEVAGISGSVIAISTPLLRDYSHTLPSWAGTTFYGYGAYITNGGHFYLQTNNNVSPYGCTSGGSTPSFSTSGGTVTDGTGGTACAWQDQGAGTTTQPQIIPYTASAKYAGIKDIQIYSNNTGYDQAVGMSECAYCWIYGVETNYLDGDISDIQYSYHDMVFGNYFSNSYGHASGTHDSCINIQQGSTGVLVQNNIMERLHVAVIMEAGAAGNVIHANYNIGNFDSGSTNAVFGSIDFHGAQPQMNLVESNVVSSINADSTWGGSWHSTTFRNWVQGTNLVCNPVNSTRGTVNCTPTGIPGGGGVNGWYAFQIARAEVFDFPSLYYNSIGNVLGSSQMQALVNTSNNPLTNTRSITATTTRAYDTVAFGYTFGYSGSGDDGTFARDSSNAASVTLIHGDYSNLTTTGIIWQTGITHTLPASFFLSSKPSWWGSVAWPSIGPDISVTGPGNHVSSLTATIPAMACYIGTMGGSDGGAGSPKTFSRSGCGW